MSAPRVCEAANCIALATHGSVCAVHAKYPSAGANVFDTIAFLKVGIDYDWRPDGYSRPVDDDEDEWITLATVALNNFLSTVVAIQARLRADGGFDLRVCDDEHGEYDWSPRYIEEPLSLQELIEFIESAEGPAGKDLVFGVLEANVSAGENSKKLANFVEVNSSVYPDLSRHFESEILLWLEKRQAES